MSTRLKPYPAYKDSGVEWLGRIPAHWEAWPLKHVTQFVNGAPFKPTDWGNEGVPIIRIENLNGGETFNRTTLTVDRKYEAQKGDILFGWSGNRGTSFGPFIWPKDGLFYVNQHIFRLEGYEAHQGWLYWMLKAVTLYVEQQAHGIIGLVHITKGDLGVIRIPLPSPDEQQSIAAFLDRETGKIDALVAKKERLIELLQEKRTALISHAVTQGLNPNVPKNNSGVPWLGRIPAHWACAPVYARYHVQLGKMLDTARITGEHLAPYLRNIDVQWDRVNVEDLPQMDFHPDDRKRFSLQPGDLLVCEGGEVGRTAVWRAELPECYYQKAIHRLRSLSVEDKPRFMFYVLLHAAKLGVFVAGGNANTIDHLTAEKLRKHRFAFPPSSEQTAIMELLDATTAKLDALISKVRAAIELLQEYRTALVSAAVTGQIDVRSCP